MLTAAGYKVLYQFQPEWWPSSLGLLVALIIGVLMWTKPQLRRGNITIGAIFVCLTWSLVSFAFTWRDSREIRHLQARGLVSIVEGPVEQFHPAPYTGHEDESFCVSQVCFHYSDFIVVNGFHQTASHGGPMHDGLWVRIQYIPGLTGLQILQLEVRE